MRGWGAIFGELKDVVGIDDARQIVVEKFQEIYGSVGKGVGAKKAARPRPVALRAHLTRHQGAWEARLHHKCAPSTVEEAFRSPLSQKVPKEHPQRQASIWFLYGALCIVGLYFY